MGVPSRPQSFSEGIETLNDLLPEGQRFQRGDDAETQAQRGATQLEGFRERTTEQQALPTTTGKESRRLVSDQRDVNFPQDAFVDATSSNLFPTVSGPTRTFTNLNLSQDLKDFFYYSGLFSVSPKGSQQDRIIGELFQDFLDPEDRYTYASEILSEQKVQHQDDFQNRVEEETEKDREDGSMFLYDMRNDENFEESYGYARNVQDPSFPRTTDQEVDNIRDDLYRLTQEQLDHLPEEISVFRRGDLGDRSLYRGSLHSFALNPRGTNSAIKENINAPPRTLFEYRVNKKDIVVSPSLFEGNIFKGEQEVLIPREKLKSYALDWKKPVSKTDTLFDVAPQEDLEKLSEAVNRLEDQVVTPDVKYSRLSTKPSNPNVMREIPINFANIPQSYKSQINESMLRYAYGYLRERGGEVLPVTFKDGDHVVLDDGREGGYGAWHIATRGHDEEIRQATGQEPEKIAYTMMRRMIQQEYGDGVDQGIDVQTDVGRSVRLVWQRGRPKK